MVERKLKKFEAFQKAIFIMYCNFEARGGSRLNFG